MIRNRICASYVIYLLFMMGCDSQENGPADNFDRSALLENMANEYIVPVYEDFVLKTTLLSTATNQFVENPNVNTINGLKAAWFEAKLTWKKAEAYNFGPIDILSVETSINLWPTSTQGIETAVIDYVDDAQYLQRVGSNKKGFPALEYLLFHAEVSVVIGEFEDNSRKGYLQLLAENLKQQAVSIRSFWNSGYRDSFVRNTGSDAEASITLLGNEMIFNVENLTNASVAEPLGLFSGNDPDPTELESYFSFMTKEMMIQNLNALKTTFNGGSGIGFDDYLMEFRLSSDDQPLEDVINSQFNIVLNLLNDLETPIEALIITDPKVVEELYDELKTLLILLKSDMTSRLNLLVIFSDNDGD